MEHDLLQRYADVIDRVGANVRPGQQVYVRGDLSHAEVARVIAERAYLAGAARVVGEYTDPHVQHSTLVHAPMETLTSSPGWALERIKEWGRDEVAIISLTGQADENLMAD